MGLSVNVYSNVERTDIEDDIDFYAYVVDRTWRHKIKHLEYDKGYKGNLKIQSGVSYSYSTHSRFREYLLKVIGREDLLGDGGIFWDKLVLEKDLPFYDLINFADNEGCLDREISKKIFEDFTSCRNDMLATDSGAYFRDLYQNWLDIFEAGKEKGSVIVFR